MRTTVALVALYLLGLLLAACGGGGQPSATPEVAAVSQAVQATLTALATTAPLPTDLPPSTPSPVPPTVTPTPEPTNTPIPTNTPEAVYTEPSVLAEIEGVGSLVTDNFEWPQCQKVVFYWTAFPEEYGAASLIVTLHNVATERDVPLVNEFAMNVSTDGMNGAVLQALLGGEYYLTTENTDEPWSLRVECQDGVAPVATGVDLQDTRNTVTENYELAACRKSVFVWAAEPGNFGTASLIADVCKVGEDECWNLVNVFDMELTAPLEGEALQPIADGVYFLAISNTSGKTWRIRWECRD